MNEIGREKEVKRWGLLAEFRDEASLVHAAQEAREAGFTRYDAFSPYPCEALSEAMDLRRGRVAFIFLVGAILGGTLAYFLQYYSAVWAYPWNVGGKPLHSWPMFLPITFELTVLGASIFGVVGMFWLNKLPQPYHPLFESKRFRRASQDRFFLVIEEVDPKFSFERTRDWLADLDAVEIEEVVT